ncbi:zinc finger protein 34-like isoform X2 [Bacillus rossius redtenbacheri]|uniref:zinc finger protein 34-like isoform X2 n=1 Tax=Bacillus rossius redtenbacheri TaxID=93214 RepID=UPI002FDE430A
MAVQLYDSTYCRLCAEDNISGVFLYSIDETDFDISSLINRYLPFKISDDGKLPRTICPGCNIQLQATVQFFDLLVEGQRKIREMWKNQVEGQRRLEQERQRGDQNVGVLVSAETSVPRGEQHGDGDDPCDRIIIQKTRAGIRAACAVMEDGTMFTTDHEMALKMQGLERPRKKRGRPPKPRLPPEEQQRSEEAIAKEPDSPEQQDAEETEEDGDGRRRRKRKVPVRFQEALQGKELERLFREQGLINQDEPEEPEETEVDEKGEATENVGQDEVIGHLETPEGQDLGELVIVNRGRRKYRLRGSKRRKVRFVCEVCGREFQHRGRYRVHRSYHRGVLFECTGCSKRFISRESFSVHQETTGHSGEGIIEGPESGCSETQSEVVADNTRVQCEKCDKTFQTKQSYEVHVKAIHEGCKPFSCEACGRVFAYQNSLKSHVTACHEDKSGGDKERSFPCELCGKRFNHPSSVVYHKEAEHNNGRRFVCNKCGKSFKHRQLLQRHQLVHSDDRPFVCKACGASFKTKANLLNHQPTHTGEKKYFCELCGQQFAHKTSLTLHYRWHTGQKPYQCHVCSKSFTQNGNLQEHLRIHTGEKPYCCDYCGRKFTTSSQFKLHVKRHTGERPWKCEFCGKSFLHKDTWRCHTRRHKGERPFQCQYCARSFTEQWALKKHVRLHTGEKPYTCEVCDKAFADCSNLTKHKKVHRENRAAGEEGGLTMSRAVWNIIQSQLPKGGGDGEVGGEAEGAEAPEEPEGMQQIIYVTYQDPDDPDNKTLHIVDELQPADRKHKLDVSDVKAEEAGGQSLGLATQPLQVMDEQGNPIQFTMQDGRQLQITTTDGQSLQVTTLDGQTIPLQLTGPDGSPEITTEIHPVSLNPAPDSALLQQAPAMETRDAAANQLVGGEHTFEFTTEDGQKVHFVTTYGMDPMALATEYLSTAS